MTRPRVLLMDEPTRGVDVGAKREIVDTMRRLAADGLAVVFTTSELGEVHAAADRALVMARGRIAAELSGRRDDRRGAGVGGVGERQAPMVAPMPESRLVERVLRLRAFIALAVVTLVFALLSPEFLTTGNLSILVKHVAINAILAIGMTFVILSGGIDLSVGSIVGFSGMVAGLLLSRGLVLPALGNRRLSRTPGSWSPCRCSREWRSARSMG